MSVSQNGHRALAIDAARALLRRRIMPLPIPLGQKNPNRREWQQERYDVDHLTAFEHPCNVGMVLGVVLARDGRVLTDRFADMDLDTIEAIRAAPFYLPPTGMMWGRASKPRSHYGYRLRSAEGVKDFKCTDPIARKRSREVDAPKAMLCELRWNGQTVAPGSINTQDGADEPVCWEPDGDGDPADVDYGVLVEAIAMIGAVALLARYWSHGVRHVAALALAGTLCRGGMHLDEALVFMQALCAAAGDDQVDNRLATVRDTYARAAAGDPYTGSNTLAEYIAPQVVTRIRQWTKLGSGAYGGDVGPDGKILGDFGNAERFGERWDGQLLFCESEGAWYVHRGTHWTPDEENLLYLRARDVHNDFRQVANNPTAQPRGNTTVDQWLRHAVKMGEKRQISSMIELSKALLPVTIDQLNSDPLLLNVQNGTLELDVQTGRVTLRAHRAEDMITMIAPVSYNPDATNDLFDECVEMFYPDAELRAFLQEHIGYALTGLPKRYSLELIGPTNAGKSMTLELFGRMLGDYAGTLKYESIMRNPHRGGDVARPDLWRVRDKRLVTIAEIPPDTHYDTALFKSLLSGGDAQNIRTFYDRTGGRDVTFAFSLWTSGNQPYGPPAGEEAAYERLHVLRCEQQVPRERRDQRKQLLTVDPAVTGDAALAWALRGFTRLYGEKHGLLVPPERVRQSTQGLQDSLDPYAELLDETETLTVTGSDDDGVVVSEVWAWVRKMREESGYRVRNPMREKEALARTLERRGARRYRTSVRFGNREYWRGVRWDPSLIDLLDVTPPDWK